MPKEAFSGHQEGDFIQSHKAQLILPTSISPPRPINPLRPLLLFPSLPQVIYSPGNYLGRT